MSDTVKVKVRVTLEYEQDWPVEYATKQHIESRHNEGTYCWDNFVDEMQEMMERKEEAGSCMCYLPRRPRLEVLEVDGVVCEPGAQEGKAS